MSSSDNDYKPMQGLSAYLRAEASRLPINSESAECLRSWAKDVDSTELEIDTTGFVKGGYYIPKSSFLSDPDIDKSIKNKILLRDDLKKNQSIVMAKATVKGATAEVQGELSLLNLGDGVHNLYARPQDISMSSEDTTVSKSDLGNEEKMRAEFEHRVDTDHERKYRWIWNGTQYKDEFEDGMWQGYQVALAAAAQPVPKTHAVVPIISDWIGCAECDCIFPCHDGKNRCIRLEPQPTYTLGDVVELKCPCGYTDRVYWGSLSAKSCPACKERRSTNVAQPQQQDATTEALLIAEQIRHQDTKDSLEGCSNKVAELALKLREMKQDTQPSARITREADENAKRWNWVLSQPAICDFIFEHLKSRERHVNNAVDAALKDSAP